MPSGVPWTWTASGAYLPTHVVLAFAKALEELRAEGGIPARYARYAANHQFLVRRLEELGFRADPEAEVQGPIITTFFYPEGAEFTFREMYQYIKERDTCSIPER